MSTNIHAYADVAAVLEAALPSGTAKYKLPSPGKARHWMQRANKYRLLLQKQLRDMNQVKGFIPTTPYDRMKLSLESNYVVINFNPQVDGELILPSGEHIKPAPAASAIAPPAAPGTFDPLADLAFELAQEVDDEN
jgi:hypothetical protein